MKLSDKILTIFFGALFLYMLVAFTEVRVRGEHNRLQDENAVIDQIELSDVGFLVVPDLGKRIMVSADAKPRIQFRSTVGDLTKYLSYTMTGDTLLLERLEVPEDIRYDLRVFVRPGQLRGLQSTHASLAIGDLESTHLSLAQHGGFTSLSGEFELDTLLLNASARAEFDSRKTNFSVLQLTMDEAEVRVRGKVQRLEGDMYNHSYLSVGSALDFAFKKDTTSRLRHSY
ncbi:MAG: hypothetical protein AAGA85_26100 [Bacteroidota bacterium]